MAYVMRPYCSLFFKQVNISILLYEKKSRKTRYIFTIWYGYKKWLRCCNQGELVIEEEANIILAVHCSSWLNTYLLNSRMAFLDHFTQEGPPSQRLMLSVFPFSLMLWHGLISLDWNICIFFQVTTVSRNKLWSTRNFRDGVSPEDVGHCRWILRFYSLALRHAYFLLPAFPYSVTTYFSWHREMHPFLNISQNKPFLL